MGTERFQPCRSRFLILSQYGDSRTANVETSFRCITDLQDYVAQRSPELRQSQNYLNVTSAATTTKTPVSQSICHWDDNESVPPSPSLSADGSVCRDVVLDVHYEVIYNNTVINKVVATYIMADVPLQTVDTVTYTKQWFEDNVTDSTSNGGGTTAATAAATTLSASTSDNSNAGPTQTTEPIRQLRQGTYTVNNTWQTYLNNKYSITFSQLGAENPVTYSGRPGIQAFVLKIIPPYS